MCFIKILQKPKKWLKLQVKVSKTVATIADWVSRSTCHPHLVCQLGMLSPSPRGCCWGTKIMVWGDGEPLAACSIPREALALGRRGRLHDLGSVTYPAVTLSVTLGY